MSGNLSATRAEPPSPSCQVGTGTGEEGVQFFGNLRLRLNPQQPNQTRSNELKSTWKFIDGLRALRILRLPVLKRSYSQRCNGCRTDVESTLEVVLCTQSL